MSTPIRLVSFDVDGTLYTPKGSAPDLKKISVFRFLLAKLRSKGVAPIICTGKPASYAEAFAEAYGFVGKNATHVCEHGASIFSYDSWKSHYYIDTAKLYATKDRSDLQKVADVVMKATGATKEEKVSSVSIIPKGLFTSGEFYGNVIGTIRSMGYSVMEAKNGAAPAREMFSLASNGKTDEEIKTSLQKSGCDFFVSKSPMAVNITPYPLTKAFGLAYVAARIQRCGLESVVAVGDDEGDIPVFDVAGLPIAVANADSAVKDFVKARGGIVSKKKSMDGAMEMAKLIIRKKTVEAMKNQ